jgi:hypothetical protein
MATLFAGLIGFYPLRGWALVRVTLFLAPWIAVLLALALSEPGMSPARRVAALVLLASLGWLSLRTVEELAGNRRAAHSMNAEATERFQRLTEGVPIETLVAWENAWEIAWRRYPVIVIWNGPLDAATLREVDKIRRIDAVFAPTGERFWKLADDASAGALGAGYQQVRHRPKAPYQVLLRAELVPYLR